MEAIVMPALGQTSDEAHILEWLVQEGEEVEMGQPLLNVETDKAQLEVEAVADGILLKIVCPAESTVNAGTVIAYIGEEGESVPE
jgi:pyruvate/2-oxoglutarate dehydrogenase complex dihydrolipoamide acyltransferase (E2) component